MAKKSLEQIKADIDKKNPTMKGITGKPIPRPKTNAGVYKQEVKNRAAQKTSRYNYSSYRMGDRSDLYKNPLATRLNKEEYEQIIQHLFYEGYVESYENGKRILSVMSEDWINSILG